MCRLGSRGARCALTGPGAVTSQEPCASRHPDHCLVRSARGACRPYGRVRGRQDHDDIDDSDGPRGPLRWSAGWTPTRPPTQSRRWMPPGGCGAVNSPPRRGLSAAVCLAAACRHEDWLSVAGGQRRAAIGAVGRGGPLRALPVAAGAATPPTLRGRRHGVREIGRRMGHSPSTVSRELRRHDRGLYDGDLAHVRARRPVHRCGVRCSVASLNSASWRQTLRGIRARRGPTPTCSPNYWLTASSSLTPPAPGRAAPTRTPTACCASTSSTAAISGLSPPETCG
jgi:hypothetical protein